MQKYDSKPFFVIVQGKTALSTIVKFACVHQAAEKPTAAV